MTRWWAFLPFHPRRRPPTSPPPTSLHDSLVDFSAFPPTTPATTGGPPPPTSLQDSLVGYLGFPPTTPATTASNESSRLVGGLFCLPPTTPATTATNESSRLVGGFFSLSHPRRHPSPPPTSLHDSLMGFSAFPPTTPATTATNESSRLVGGFSRLSTHDFGHEYHQGHHHHQRVFMTRWCIILFLQLNFILEM